MKKTDQITIHLTEEQKMLFLALAELESMTGSELGLRVIDEFIKQKYAVYHSMKKVFDNKEL